MRSVPGAFLAALVIVTGGLVAGCGAEAGGDPVLTVYLSTPLSGPSTEDGQDIADGAELALANADGQAADTAVELEVLDDATRKGWDAARTGANARLASQDSTAIAYLGELDSGATRTSLPITNEAGILQVSAGSGAEDLTRAALGSDQVPTLTQPSGLRTFGRVIPSDEAQGEVAAGWMSEMGIASVEVIGGEDPFGRTLISGLESSSAAPTVVGEGEGAEAFYVAAESTLLGPRPPGGDFGVQRSLLPLPSDAAPIFGSDALLTPDELTWLRIFTTACEPRTDCPGRPRSINATSAALDPSQLPPEAADFLSNFQAAYDRSPSRYGAYGYEAMALVLDSIERAEDPLDRTAVVDAFFATTDRESILGTYSIDGVGDTTLAQLGAYRVVNGRPVPEPRTLDLP